MVKTKIFLMLKEKQQTVLFDHDQELMEFVYRSEKIKIVLVLISIVMLAYCVDETEMEIKSLD